MSKARINAQIAGVALGAMIFTLGGCERSPNGGEQPQTEAAGERPKEAAEQAAGKGASSGDELTDRTLKLLDMVGAECGGDEKVLPEMLLMRCRKWRRSVNSARGAFDRFQRGRPGPEQDTFGRLDAAVTRLGDEQPVVRAAVRELMAMAFKRLRYQPDAADVRYHKAIIERIKATEDEQERVLLFRLMSLYTPPSLGAALVELAGPGQPEVVRAGAMEALGRCMKDGCEITPEQVKGWHEGATGAAKVGLLGLAGRMAMNDEVLAWCPEGDLDPGCRLALRRLDHPEARRRLMARLKAALADDQQLARIPEAAQDVILQTDRMADRADFFALLKQSFKKAEQAPAVFIALAEQLAVLEPYPETAPLAVSIYIRLEKEGWDKDPNSDRGVALDALREAIKAIGAGKQIGIEETGHNHNHGGPVPKHGGHDHAGHDHAGHDHAGHDHAGHDHAGHDHGAKPDHDDHGGHDHGEHDH